MNALTRDLIKLTKLAEEGAKVSDRFRQRFHLMPPVGWLNDPNGLCQGSITRSFSIPPSIRRAESSCGDTARAET